jgi:hypothetical protein
MAFQPADPFSIILAEGLSSTGKGKCRFHLTVMDIVFYPVHEIGVFFEALFITLNLSTKM